MQFNMQCPHCLRNEMEFHTTCVRTDKFGSKSSGYWECNYCKKTVSKDFRDDIDNKSNYELRLISDEQQKHPI